MYEESARLSWSVRVLLVIVLTVGGAAAGFSVAAGLRVTAPRLTPTGAPQSSAVQSPSPRSGTPSPSTPAVSDPPVTDSPVPDPPVPAPPVPAGPPVTGVGALAGDAPEPSAALLASLLNKAFDAKALITRPGGIVLDGVTGDILYDHSSGTALVPASTAKLATAAAALTVLGPAARLTTRVLDDPAAGRVVLVGGGDPTLAAGASPDGFAAARLVDLAQATATALKARGQTRVTVGYDAGIFSGPAVAPGWKPVYVTEGDVAPVGGLMLDGGRVAAGADPRVPDPAGAAGQRFAGLLTADGIQVTGRARAAVGGGAEIASVVSPPVSALVERMLTLSDNDIAEALARHVSLKKGGAGSFAAGAAAVSAAVGAIGIPGVRLTDGSGLSTQDRVTPAALAALLRRATDRAHPE
ncbi:MAG: hypothetical protein QOG52_142, partial [Frankiaceae bacterium]|nr:hypothetical protein [Frankiaceae bacterium]